jgi:hypothetical protein
MCACRSGPMLPRMQAITVTLRLETAGDSLTGSAIDAAGARKEFSGWLGLVSALEALLSTAPLADAGGSK